MADLSKLTTEQLMALREQKKLASQPQAASVDLSQMPTEDLIRLREQKVQQQRAITPVESTVRGGFQGASYGFVDELAGKLEGVGSLIGVRGLGGGFDEWRMEKPEEKDQKFSDVAAARTATRRAQDSEAKRQNSGYYAGGHLLGSIAATSGKAGIAPTAGLIKTTLKLGGLGAVEAAGTTDAKLGSDEFKKDVATGAAISAAFGPVGYLAQKLKPSELKKFANIKAVKAAGGMTKELRDLGPDKVQEVGREILESKIVSTFSNLDDVLERTDAARSKVGAGIGAAVKQVDDLIDNAKEMVDSNVFGNLSDKAKGAFKDKIDDMYGFNKKNIADRIRKEIIEPNAGNPILKGQMNALETIAQGFETQKASSMAEGLLIKGSQGKITKFESDTVPHAFKKQLYGVIREELEESAAKIGFLESAIARAKGNSIGEIDALARGKSFKNMMKELNNKYAKLSDIKGMAKKSWGRVQSNRSISLTDTIMGGAGLVAGTDLFDSPLGGSLGLVALGLNKFGRTYGNNIMAVAANNIASKMLKSPEAVQKWSGVLTDAATQGSVALTATHLKLMKDDPEYRAMALSQPSQGLTVPGQQATGLTIPGR